MENLVDIEMTIGTSYNSIIGLNFDRKTKSISDKIKYDYACDKVEHMLNDDQFIDYNYMNCYNIHNKINNKSYDDHRVIIIDVTSFVAYDTEAEHVYAGLRISSLNIGYKNKPNRHSSSSSYDDDFKVELYMYNDDIDKIILKNKGEYCDKSSSRIRSIEKMINGIVEFINECFEKEKFIISIKDDTSMVKNSDIQYIEKMTGIKTFIY